MGDRKKLKPGIVRRLVVVGLALTVAALACNVPGAANQPVLEPVEPDDSSLDSQAGEDGPETTPPEGEAGEPPSELSPDRIDQIVRASVQIWAGDIVGGRFESMWSGSGTLISPDGQILTNCHVACGAPVLLISMTTDPDQPPEDRYLAEITHYDDQLDLALLQIVSDVNGSSVSPTLIAGVVRSALRSDTPLTKFLHTVARDIRSINAFSRRPNAIVSRRCAASEWRSSPWSRSTANIAWSRATAALDRGEPFGPRFGLGWRSSRIRSAWGCRATDRS